MENSFHSSVLQQRRNGLGQIAGELYNELLGLINSQDWGRGRKFSEKKTICNHLIDLYRQNGMIPEMKKAKEERDKYLNARKICSEAARLKGYKSGKER